jgi:hypothetical protein
MKQNTEFQSKIIKGKRYMVCQNSISGGKYWGGNSCNNWTEVVTKTTSVLCSACTHALLDAPDIGNYFNHEGIIELTPDFDIDSLTEELYNSKIEAVKDNFERVQNLLSADDMLYKQINEN